MVALSIAFVHLRQIIVAQDGVSGESEKKAGSADERLAREYLKRKRLVKPKDRKQSARIFRQLMRAGFAAKTIFVILKKWDVDDDTLSALESEIE